MPGPLREATLADVVASLEVRYPLDSAEPWDAVGLVCGDPATVVRRILWAVDPSGVVLDEALDWGADLIVTHHPLFLTGVHSVAATTPKGRFIHRSISAGIALYAVHTNADVAAPGVSDALAHALGVRDLSALAPKSADKPEVGLGRIGVLPTPMALGDFAAMVASVLPATGHGVRVMGDPESLVRTVAVCGGSGDSLLATATEAGADVYVTADLKHHRTLDHLDNDGCSVVDVAHWASEWPWLPQAADLLVRDLESLGATVDCRVSTTVTDPWSWHQAAE